MARYLGESVAASKRTTSEPLRIFGERRGTFARGILAVTSLPVVEPSRQRTAARFTLRVLGVLPLRQRSSRKVSTSAAVTTEGALPTWARKHRAQPANVDTVFGRSPRRSMQLIILSIDFCTSVGSDMGISLAWVNAKESPVIDLKTRTRARATISDRDIPRPAPVPAKSHGRQAAAQAASSKRHYVN